MTKRKKTPRKIKNRDVVEYESAVASLEQIREQIVRCGGVVPKDAVDWAEYLRFLITVRNAKAKNPLYKRNGKEVPVCGW